MKALTIRQPWAWAIVFAGKRVENRTWATAYRGPIAIHAGMSRASLGGRFLPDGTRIPPATGLVFGALIGMAELVSCMDLGEALLERPDDPFVEGPCCWLLENVRPLLRPVFCPGERGLFNVTDYYFANVPGQPRKRWDLSLFPEREHA